MIPDNSYLAQIPVFTTSTTLAAIFIAGPSAVLSGVLIGASWWMIKKIPDAFKLHPESNIRNIAGTTGIIFMGVAAFHLGVVSSLGGGAAFIAVSISGMAAMVFALTKLGILKSEEESAI